MNSFETWFINRVLRKEVFQGPTHKRNIENIYRMVRKACEEEFTEDNDPTLDTFLRECFENTVKGNNNA